MLKYDLNVELYKVQNYTKPYFVSRFFIRQIGFLIDTAIYWTRYPKKKIHVVARNPCLVTSIIP